MIPASRRRNSTTSQDTETPAEEIDADTGAHLGNYPQAFSHIGIINSALYLGYVQGKELSGTEPMGIRLGEPVSWEEG